MKTKEEIYKENAMTFCMDKDVLTLDYSGPMKAMEEYAKQEAIEFGRWLMKNGYKLSLAAPQLYEKFQKEKSTNV